MSEAIDVSVVIPCLNEADTLALCLQKASAAIASLNVQGEIVVADNGSDDGSQDIAKRFGARLVDVKDKGYGNALMGGITASRGRWIVMGDADDSYDFGEIPKFIDKLREGADLVQGCRLPSGGGRVLPGAMPFLHRYLGNPMFSFLVRRWFHVAIHDVYCGLRGFTRAHYDRLKMRCTGMEFATEMILKSGLHGAKIAEVPITLHPDGRTSHAPHLKTFRDGWRTIRLFLLLSPRWLFLVPGLISVFLGLIGYCIALPGMTILGATFDAHTLLFSSLFVLVGYQSVLFAIFTKTFGVNEGLMPPDRRLDRFFQIVNLERSLLVALFAFVIGVVLLLIAVDQWRLAGFGRLDYSRVMRLVIPGATLTALAVQTALSSFFVSILGMHKK